MNSYVGIEGRWNARHESLEALAARLHRWLSRLGEIASIPGVWERGGLRRHRSVVPRLVTTPPDADELRDWIAENPVFAAREGYKQTIGYSIDSWTPDDSGSRGHLWISASIETSPGWADNRLGIVWYPPPGNPEALIKAVRAVVLATGTAWDCAWAAAAPGDYKPREPGEPLCEIRSGWMVYLGEALASRLGEPEGIPMERFSNGASLLTTVPDAVFDHENRNHWEAAHRLQLAFHEMESGDGR